MKDKLAPSLEAWILFDATTDVKYIKMNPADGSLAIFDTEEAAMRAKSLTHGTDYERCEYYSVPQPTPEVQEEPVAWVTEDTVEGQEVNGKPRRIWWENSEGVGTPIYITPQPSFQLPNFATDPDDSDEGASLMDHGFKWGWNSCLEAVAKAMRSAEQQSAPDVSGLVKALEEIINPVRFMQERLEEGMRLNGMAAVQLAEDAEYLRDIAIAALEAYRKQQEPNHDD